MARRVSRRAVAEPVPFFQRPNVRAALMWGALCIGGGYIVSRTLVISRHEEQEVLDKYKHASITHDGSELYETIRKSEERLKDKKQ